MRKTFFILLFFSPTFIFADENTLSLVETLKQRVGEDPFRLFSALLFLGAIIHTFMAGKLSVLSHKVKEAHKQRMLKNGALKSNSNSVFAECLHVLGEVEAIFALWLLPLVLGYIGLKGWAATVEYFETRHYTEPIFVVVIMTIASTKPVLEVAEKCLRGVVFFLGGNKPACWWLSILLIAPLLGSLITEPAAMTIASLLLSKQIYTLKPSKVFKYATLGLLFVNISVGGVLTNFAAPPVLMVASRWGWSSLFMFKHFGIEAILGILMATLTYALIFAKELRALNNKAHKENVNFSEKTVDSPFLISLIHLLFLGWTVLNAHHVPFLIWGFLLFLVFTQITSDYQDRLTIKGPLLVGCFLAGLVTHGGLQEWWIQALLTQLGENALFFGSVVLTAFNDNAAITYLASLVREFGTNFPLQYSVVSGAVVGGGLTVIANAPNPAGQSILSKHFPNGVIEPFCLLLGALLPTSFMILSFRIFGKLIG